MLISKQAPENSHDYRAGEWLTKPASVSLSGPLIGTEPNYEALARHHQPITVKVFVGRA